MQVEEVETLSPCFRTVDLRVDAGKPVAWTPGQQIQIGVGTGSFTAMSWDAATGRTRLAFLHGDAQAAGGSEALMRV
jgi:hypothetical protein